MCRDGAGGECLWAKKTARTFCCSCREASDANYFQLEGGMLYHLVTGIYTT